MEERTKVKILGTIEVVVLLVLIIVRLFISSDENIWISTLNYVGLMLAYVSLYFEVRADCLNYKKFDFVTGIFVISIIPLTILAGVIATGLITLSTKSNDIILLITLLISLPMQLYKSIILNAIKD